MYRSMVGVWVCKLSKSAIGTIPVFVRVSPARSYGVPQGRVLAPLLYNVDGLVYFAGFIGFSSLVVWRFYWSEFFADAFHVLAIKLFKVPTFCLFCN